MQVQSINNIKFNDLKTNNNVTKTPSFGMNNPQLAMLRAQKLKAEYAKAGINYLLPNEVWSTKKIMQTIDNALDACNEILFNNEKFTAKNLNKIVSDILPKNVAEKIEIKDLKKDYPQVLKANGFTDNEINSIIGKIKGTTILGKDKTTIFIPLDNNKNLFDSLSLEDTFLHELKHAITNRTTNINANDTYKNPLAVNKYHNSFKELERTYEINNDIFFEPVDYTSKNLLKNIVNTKTGKTFNKMEDLDKDIIKETKNIFGKIFNKDTLSFFNPVNALKYLQHYAKDEKEAYTTQKIFRMCLDDDEIRPAGIELRSAMYEYFESLFKELANNPKKFFNN